MNDTISMVVMAGLLLLVLIVIWTLPTLWLWNLLMPQLFNLPTITFWQAMGLNALSTILFKDTLHVNKS